jgi:hypothetical protein
MRFAHAYLGISIALLGVAASAAPDDTTAADSDVRPGSASAATDANASPAKDRRHTRAERRRQHETATAAAAPESPRPASAQVAAGAAASEALLQPEKVCRNMEVVGSKIPRRVCATPDEWAAFENRAQEDAKDGLRRLRNQGALAPPSPGASPSALPPTH